MMLIPFNFNMLIHLSSCIQLCPCAWFSWSCQAKINLIDLAGSERTSKASALNVMEALIILGEFLTFDPLKIPRVRLLPCEPSLTRTKILASLMSAMEDFHMSNRQT